MAPSGVRASPAAGWARCARAGCENRDAAGVPPRPESRLGALYEKDYLLGSSERVRWHPFCPSWLALPHTASPRCGGDADEDGAGVQIGAAMQVVEGVVLS